MIFRFLHLPKPKKFSFKPVYYDPEKEEKEERERRIKDELGISEKWDPSKPYKAHIKGQFRKMKGFNTKSGEEQRRKSNNRLFLFIVLLAILAYFLFYR